MKKLTSTLFLIIALTLSNHIYSQMFLLKKEWTEVVLTYESGETKTGFAKLPYDTEVNFKFKPTKKGETESVDGNLIKQIQFTTKDDSTGTMRRYFVAKPTLSKKLKKKKKKKWLKVLKTDGNLELLFSEVYTQNTSGFGAVSFQHVADDAYFYYKGEEEAVYFGFLGGAVGGNSMSRKVAELYFKNKCIQLLEALNNKKDKLKSNIELYDLYTENCSISK